MPEIKHDFTAGKMNKDLDERLVRNGEYRDALNVQVRTTDGGADGIGDAGAVQNIEGNYRIGSSFGDYDGTVDPITNVPNWAVYNGALEKVSIGSISDEKNDKAYFFFACNKTIPRSASTITSIDSRRTYVDSIIEQDANLTTTPVMVDVYAIADTADNLLGVDYDYNYFEDSNTYNTITGITGLTVDNQIKEGSVFNAYNSSGLLIMSAKIQFATLPVIKFYDDQNVNLADLDCAFIIIEDQKRTLNFNPNKKITAVNIIENLLFWTDGLTEPKRLNIEKSKQGTVAYDQHTELRYTNQLTGEVNANAIQNDIGESFGFVNYGIQDYVREENITVIRRAPKTPPTIHVDQSIASPVSIQTFFNTQDASTGAVTEYENGDIVTIDSDVFENSGNLYLTNDYLIFTSQDTGGLAIEDALVIRCKFISYINTSTGDPSSIATSRIKLEIVRISDDGIAGFPNVNSISPPLVPDSGINFIVEVDTESVDALFELKFPRFGYRYRYQDGEYSSFSPFSQIVFEPQNFDYSVKKGYNLGMRNKIRQITIKDFIPFITDRGLDVDAIDILYKTTDNANVYVVKTIERDISPEWENNTPSSDTYADGNRDTGSLTITSEMIHRVLPANQILRAWDNVPRYATAQEITANRLIYGNYVQGYKVDNRVELIQEIKSETTATVDSPKQSIKSIRNYKLGMVFGDIYGRETPVIESGITVNSGTNIKTLTGDIVVDKSLCALANRFVVTQLWNNGDPLNWMDYVKYYVKETTNEYYNLVMDRWYYAENNDNMWISFASADRNKLDEESYLILKNKHGDNTPVLEKARYKVIAIENEAPDFIKIDYRTIGKIPITPDELGITSSTSLTDDPTELLGIDELELSSYNDFLNKYDIRGELYWRFVGEFTDSTSTVHTNNSGDYQVLNHWRVMPTSDNGVFKWEDKTGDEANLRQLFITELGASTVSAGAGIRYYFELQERVVQNRPEFDGRFFVLIEKDELVEEYIELMSGVDVDYMILDTFDISFIDTQLINPADTGPYAGYQWRADDIITPAANAQGITDSGLINTLKFMNTMTTDPTAANANGSYIDYFAMGCDAGNGANTGNMTQLFWQRFTKARVISTQSYNRVFLDGARAAKHQLNPGLPTEGGDTYPYSFKQRALYQGGAANGTKGNMVLSQIIQDNDSYSNTGRWHGIDRDSWDQGEGTDEDNGQFPNPGGLGDLYDFLEVGNFFQFEEDPNTRYKITGITKGGSSYATGGDINNGADTRNYRKLSAGNDTISGIDDQSIYNLFTNLTIGDHNSTTCRYCQRNQEIIPEVCSRFSIIVEFRRVNDDGTISDEGVDTDIFDPRGEVRHDGQGTFGIQHLKQIVNPGGVVVPETDRAIWETEPKEGPDLEIYYAATHAIPMNIRRGNALSFMPLKSKIAVERESVNGLMFEQNLSANDINSSSGADTYENVNVADVYYNESNPIVRIESTEVSSGDVENHVFNIGIGDTIIFHHNNYTITNSKILGHYKNIGSSSLLTLFRQEEFEMIISWPNDATYPNLINGSFEGTPFTSTPPPVQTGANIIGSDVPSGVFMYNFGTGNIRISDTSWMSVGTTYNVTGIMPTGFYEVDSQVWKYPVKLGWHNCWSYGNGLETDRIRDDFNGPQVDNGVKASTTLTDYKVENITSGMIYSGIYNSTSSKNCLNEFNMSEKITKSLNPLYGSIQAFKTRDKNVVVFTEDRVLQVLAGKDALFNADGSSQLTASDRVLGTAIPYAGDYGISKNPESLASDQYRLYFTDKQRGAVLRLSRDGLTPISDIGMKTWFRENLLKADTALGTFDKVNGEYNLTLIDDSGSDYTVSFNEGGKGWVSFKSFIPESGTSVSGKYLTSKNGLIYQHYWKEFEDNGFFENENYIDGDCEPFENMPSEYRRCIQRNNFYGIQYESKISVLFNDMPSVVKSFQTMNYEGSQSRIKKYTESNVADDFGNILDSLTDGEYYNLFKKNGWYLESFNTDLQTGNIPEFKSKENKWFNKLYGETTDFNNLDTKEFSVQGIGIISDAILPEPPEECISDIYPYVNGQISYTVNEGQVVTLVANLGNVNVTTGVQGSNFYTFLITPTAEAAYESEMNVENGITNEEMGDLLTSENNITLGTIQPDEAADILVYSSVNETASYANFYQGTANEFDWVNDLPMPILSSQGGSSSVMALTDPNGSSYNGVGGFWTSNAANFSSFNNIGGDNYQLVIPMIVQSDQLVEDEQESFWITAFDQDGIMEDCVGDPVQVEITIVSSDVEIIPEPQYLSLKTVDSSTFPGSIDEISEVDEGDSFTIVLETANVPDGTQVGLSFVYVWGGAENVDFVDGSSPDNIANVGHVFTIDNNQASIEVNVAEDLEIENVEILFMALTNMVNDAADTEFAQNNVDLNPILDSAGNSFTPLTTQISIIDGEIPPENVYVQPRVIIDTGSFVNVEFSASCPGLTGNGVADETFSCQNLNWTIFNPAVSDENIISPVSGYLVDAANFTIPGVTPIDLGSNIFSGQGNSIYFEGNDLADAIGTSYNYIQRVIFTNTGDPTSPSNTVRVDFQYHNNFVIPLVPTTPYDGQSGYEPGSVPPDLLIDIPVVGSAVELCDAPEHPITINFALQHINITYHTGSTDFMMANAGHINQIYCDDVNVDCSNPPIEYQAAIPFDYQTQTFTDESGQIAGLPNNAYDSTWGWEYPGNYGISANSGVGSTNYAQYIANELGRSIISTSTVGDLNNLVTWPCRAVRINAPEGATVANGGLPQYIKILIFNSNGYDIRALCSTTDTSESNGIVVWNDGTIAPTNMINMSWLPISTNFEGSAVPPGEGTDTPYVIHNVSGYNGSLDGGNFPVTITLDTIQMYQISNSHFELWIPVNPDFVVPSGSGEINVVIPCKIT